MTNKATNPPALVCPDHLYTLSTAPKHDTNPFLAGLVVQTRHRSLTVARGTQLQTADGTNEAMTTIAQVKLVDEEQFVKLYTSQLRSFFEISTTGFRVLSVVLQAIQTQAVGTDRVYLDFSDVAAFARSIDVRIFSRKTYERGLAEMLTKGFLARTEKPNFYFFNPALFFNGDRARFVTEYRKAKANEQQAQLF